MTNLTYRCPECGATGEHTGYGRVIWASSLGGRGGESAAVGSYGTIYFADDGRDDCDHLAVMIRENLALHAAVDVLVEKLEAERERH